MQGAIVSVVLSAGALLTLLALFHIESRRGSRYFEEVRMKFDSAVLYGRKKIARVRSLFAYELMRQSMHYLFHRLLRGLKRLVKYLERQIDALLRTNKSFARTMKKKRSSGGKLQHVMQHKESIALSEEEKKSYKEKSIGTKL